MPALATMPARGRAIFVNGRWVVPEAGLTPGSGPAASQQFPTQDPRLASQEFPTQDPQLATQQFPLQGDDPKAPVPASKPKNQAPRVNGIAAAFENGAPVPASKPEAPSMGRFFPGKEKDDRVAVSDQPSMGNFFPGRAANDLPAKEKLSEDEKAQVADAEKAQAGAEKQSGFAKMVSSPGFGSILRNIGLGILRNPGDPFKGIADGIDTAGQEDYARAQDEQAYQTQQEQRESAAQEKADARAERQADRLGDQAWRQEQRDYQRSRDEVSDSRWQQDFDREGEQQQWTRGQQAAAAKNAARLTESQIAKNNRVETTGESSEYLFGIRETPDGKQVEVRRNKGSGDVEYMDSAGSWVKGVPEGSVRAEDGYMGDQQTTDVKGFGKEFVASGIAARKGLQDTGRILDLLETAKTNKAYFGPGAEGIQKFRQLATGLGLANSEQIGNAKTIEEATAMAGDAMLAKMAMLGGNDSNEELKRIMALGFNPTDTLEGNIAKMQQVQAGLQYLMDRGDYAATYEGRPRDMLNSWNTSRTGKRIYEGLPNDGAASGGSSGTTSSGLKWSIK